MTIGVVVVALSWMVGDYACWYCDLVARCLCLRLICLCWCDFVLAILAVACWVLVCEFGLLGVMFVVDLLIGVLCCWICGFAL